MSLLVYMVEVRNPRLPDAWLPALLGDFRAHGLGVEVWEEGRGWISTSEHIGSWAAISVADFRRVCPGWRPAPNGCPYLGPVVGLIAVIGYLDEVPTSLVEVLRWTGMGALYHRRALEVTDWSIWRGVPPVGHSVGWHSFPVDGVLSKFGFSDGDRLLSRDHSSPYFREVYRRICAAVAAAGVAPLVNRMETSHNPFRMNYLLERAGGEMVSLLCDADGEQIDIEAAFARLSGRWVWFWAFFDSWEALPAEE